MSYWRKSGVSWSTAWWVREVKSRRSSTVIFELNNAARRAQIILHSKLAAALALNEAGLSIVASPADHQGAAETSPRCIVALGYTIMTMFPGEEGDGDAVAGIQLIHTHAKSFSFGGTRLFQISDPVLHLSGEPDPTGAWETGRLAL